MPKVPINLMIDEELKKEFQEQAEARGITLTDLIISATKLYTGFENQAWKNLQYFSNEFQVPDVLFLQNTLIDWIARKAASLELKHEEGYLFPELMMTPKGVLTGSALYETLFDYYKTLFSKIESKENREPNEDNIRIEYTKKRERERQRVRAAMKQGLIPEDTKDTPTVARLVEMHEKDEITDDELKRKIAHYKRESGWK